MALGALVAGSLQLLWPARCVACDRFVPEAAVFCPLCELSVNRLAGICAGCALPQADGNPDGRPCLLCRRLPFPFTRASAGFEYGEAVAAAILRMKHGARRDVARRLGRLLAEPMADAIAGGGLDQGDAIAPVPLHPRRLRRRGFNQALELARGALRGLGGRACANGGQGGWPRLERRLLQRTRATRELGHAGPAERMAEVAGAFAVGTRARVRGRRILLVDDVLTTGATLSACADVLREAGARDVHVLALARAV